MQKNNMMLDLENKTIDELKNILLELANDFTHAEYFELIAFIEEMKKQRKDEYK